MALAWANTWHFGTTPLVSSRLKWRLRNDYRNSILMTDLGSAYDWLKKISLTVRPIRITTQIWVVKLSGVISQTSSRGGKPVVVASRNVGCFLRLTWPYGSSPQSESLEQGILEEGLRVSYKTILAIISQLCRAARKVSPDWSQKTMTCHSFDCFSIVWGSVGDFSSEQLLHDPNERTGKGKNL